jgi:hypothetical protein
MRRITLTIECNVALLSIIEDDAAFFLSILLIMSTLIEHEKLQKIDCAIQKRMKMKMILPIITINNKRQGQHNVFLFLKLSFALSIEKQLVFVRLQISNR